MVGHGGGDDGLHSHGAVFHHRQRGHARHYGRIWHGAGSGAVVVHGLSGRHDGVHADDGLDAARLWPAPGLPWRNGGLSGSVAGGGRKPRRGDSCAVSHRSGGRRRAGAAFGHDHGFFRFWRGKQGHGHGHLWPGRGAGSCAWPHGGRPAHRQLFLAVCLFAGAAVLPCEHGACRDLSAGPRQFR